MPDQVRLVVDGAAMAELLRGPDGPVMRALIRAGDDVIVGAVKYINGRRRYPGATHRLERSIVKRPTTSPSGVGITVAAGVGLKPGYAIWVHEGNAPAGSRIVPKKAAHLAFVTSGARPTDTAGWQTARGAGRAVIVRSVAASRPNPFLRDSLHDVMLARFGH